MRKIFLLISMITILLLFVISCDTVNSILGNDSGNDDVDDSVCEHEWTDATCQAPRTCTKCSATEGETGDHNYAEATCTLPSVCSTCGIWYGGALGHDYTPASCEGPKKCKNCGHEQGDPLHEFAEATCTTPKICVKCDYVASAALGHTLDTVTVSPTCTSEGSERTYCTVCDHTENNTVIPMVSHASLSFVYNGDTTATKDGTATISCPHCDYSVTKTLEGTADLVKEAFAGKKISILGDSISTYIDVTSGIAADTTNSTIRNNIVWYGYNPTQPTFGGSSVDSTWWQTTINELGATRLVNNSYSGDRVFDAIKGRYAQLHDDTGDNAGETPDIILIYLGTNDIHATSWGYPSALTMSGIQQMGDNPSYAPKSLAEAYAILLYRVQKAYPEAEIYCLTNLERSDAEISVTHAISNVIRGVVEHFDGVYLADIGLESGITRDNPEYETYMPKDQGGKSLHPGTEGMKEIARVVIESMIANSRYMSEEFYELLPEGSVE